MRASGFTIIEILMVIVAIAVMSVMVLPTWHGPVLSLEYNAKHVLDDIRYTQALSQATGLRYRWVRTSATTYEITNNNGNAINLSSGGTMGSLATGVSFGSMGNLPNAMIVFNGQGVPYTDTGMPGTALATTATILLTANGETKTISIYSTTGYGMLQ